MAEFLCQHCQEFKRLEDPQFSKEWYGHCRALEYPFLLAIAKEARPGVFSPPSECHYFQKKKRRNVA